MVISKTIFFLLTSNTHNSTRSCTLNLNANIVHKGIAKFLSPTERKWFLYGQLGIAYEYKRRRDTIIILGIYYYYPIKTAELVN